mmetsp:Transcript_71285/g.201218  ORF Transcript_71285/g.201218 Transcript_71285/m.201218 type:complete len:291 (+) Transcript_71285:821-1693(+)
MAVSHPKRGIVRLLWLYPHDLRDVRDLGVVHRLGEVRIPDVQQLPAQGEDPVSIPANDAQAGNGERLGTVALGEDERALAAVAPAREVRILELRDVEQPLPLPSATAAAALQRLAQVDLLLRLGPREHHVDDAGLEHLVDHGLADLALGPELRLLQRQRLLGLRVERGVLDLAVHEDPQVVAHVVRLDVHASLVLGVDALHDRLDELVCHVRDVRAALQGRNPVDEGDLLELALRQAHRDLPPLVALLVDDLGALLPAEVEVHVLLEVAHLQQLPVQVDLAPLRRAAGDI